jgi:hypothetical protein
MATHEGAEDSVWSQWPVRLGLPDDHPVVERPLAGGS